MEKLGNRSMYFGSNPIFGFQSGVESFGDIAVMCRDWLRRKTVVKNVALVVIVYLLSEQLCWHAGKRSAEKTIGPMAAAAPRLSIDEKDMMARFHENYLRMKANGKPYGIAVSSPR